MYINSKIKLGLAIFFTSLIFSSPAKAATIELSLENDIVNATDDISVLVTINSEGQEVNTAQAVISFPATLLSVTSLDHTDSILTFWLEEPKYDNTVGTIRFVGGSTSGLNGASLKVLRIGFKVKGSGTGRLNITDGAITSSDGIGSNVYNTAKGLDINIPTNAQFESVQIEQSNRAAALAEELPSILGIDVPFYPDQTKWNNRSASFQAKWKITPDTTRVAVIINDNSVFTPVVDPTAISGSKIFSALTDGVWYLHLRLENNIGWSPTLHYRIAVDTTPPNPFVITCDTGLKTDDPKPTISFATSDITSGIDNYVIRLDGTIATTTNQISFTFPPLLPGVHQLVVMAIDKAGNSISQSEKLEILPIPSPVISSVTRRVIVNEGQIIAGGTASSGVDIIIQIQNAENKIVTEQMAPTDASGNWSVTVNQALNSGNYKLLATARNKNMASSFPTISDIITVKPKPVLVLGSLEINQTWFFISLIIILLSTFAAGWLTYRKWRGQLGNRVTIAQRDVMNIFDNINKDIDELLKNSSGNNLSGEHLSQTKAILKNMKNNLDKSRGYVIENIREIER